MSVLTMNDLLVALMSYIISVEIHIHDLAHKSTSYRDLIRQWV